MYKLPLYLVVIATIISGACAQGPLWKVFAQTNPLFRGRADPIVDPGVLSQHSHKVFGGSAFAIFNASTEPLAVYDIIANSNCTTSSITIDKTNYWVPDLYYQWENGSFSLVPNGGLTVYYPSRGGSGNQTYPDWQPHPKGFRMTSGTPTRRSYNGSVADQAVSYVCLDYSGAATAPQGPGFPTANWTCPDGLRAQVWFPMCWDGVNLDSPDHQSHVSFPIEAPDHGNCPDGFPVRLPGVFFEVLFSIDNDTFPHGMGRQPFVWSNGDPTGYGYHGDFMNGWIPEIVYEALHDVSCYSNNTNSGNDVQNCIPLAPYVKADNDDLCLLETPIYTYEDLGIDHLISHLPGCNPVFAGPESAVACSGSWPMEILPSIQRVLIKSATNGLFVSCLTSDTNLFADTPADQLSYRNVFILQSSGSDQGGLSIECEFTSTFVSASSRATGALSADRNSPSTWEFWNITAINGSFVMSEESPSSTTDLTPVNILSFSDSLYVTVLSDGTLWPNYTTPDSHSAQFYFFDANANVADTRTNKDFSEDDLATSSSTSTSTTTSSSSSSSKDHDLGSGTLVAPSSAALLVAFLVATALLAFAL